MKCEHNWQTVKERVLYHNEEEEHIEAELRCSKCKKVAVAFARRMWEEEK